MSIGNRVWLRPIKAEIGRLGQEYPNLKNDELFVLLFLLMFLTDNQNDAIEALCGGSYDGKVDAVYIDNTALQVNLIQGKNRQNTAYREHWDKDIQPFLSLADLPTRDSEELNQFYERLNDRPKKLLEEGIKKVKECRYKWYLYFVTLGSVSETIVSRAERFVKEKKRDCGILFVDGRMIRRAYPDYLQGVAAAPPKVTLTINSDGKVATYDSVLGVRSWVFSTGVNQIRQLYQEYGDRLFGKNIRGFLGEKTKVNRDIVETLRRRPRHFWYLNNGITVICDTAAECSGSLELNRPQIINGLQTTRSIVQVTNQTEPANVLVKVISVPPASNEKSKQKLLAIDIIQATNWQNRIEPSDLVSNDKIQVHLERELRKLGYQYIRKNQKKSAARAVFKYGAISKIEMARALAACEGDPADIFKGRQFLFGEREYKRLFKPDADAVTYYLNRFLIMKCVRSACRGRQRWQHAKWLVLHAGWDLLKTDLQLDSCQRFYEGYEDRNSRVSEKLRSMMKLLFRRALKFYQQEKRGDGLDRALFFKRKELYQGFAKSWREGDNSALRSRFKQDLADVKELLRKRGYLQ
jgi:hypothetical protein